MKGRSKLVRAKREKYTQGENHRIALVSYVIYGFKLNYLKQQSDVITQKIFVLYIFQLIYRVCKW